VDLEALVAPDQWDEVLPALDLWAEDLWDRDRDLVKEWEALPWVGEDHPEMTRDPVPRELVGVMIKEASRMTTEDTRTALRMWVDTVLRTVAATGPRMVADSETEAVTSLKDRGTAREVVVTRMAADTKTEEGTRTRDINRTHVVAMG